MAMSQEYTDRYAVGRSHGWNHAAFVDAYGPEHERPCPSYDGDNTTDGEMGYADGWTDGLEAYAEEQYDE